MKFSIIVDGRAVTFPLFVAGYDFFSSMLAQYEPSEIVSAVDQLSLVGLVERHPKSEQKVGCGIDHFEVRKRAHGAPCFHIVRHDGTVEEFSFRVAVRGRY